MNTYYEVFDGGNSKGKVVAQLDRTNLTRLFGGAFRIYNGRGLLKPCDVVRFLITPPDGGMAVRLDTMTNRDCLEIPLKVVIHRGVALWLHGVIPNEIEVAVFVLPPGTTDSGKACARIWLAIYQPNSSTSRPNQYTYRQSNGEAEAPVASCGDSPLPSLDSCPRGEDRPAILQDDEAEGYHED